MKPVMITLFGIFLLAHSGEALHAQGEVKMKITSPDFKNNELIPKKFTCDGEDASPCLVIESIPQQAKSLALVVDDPDAPMGTWVHWVVYDMPLLGRIEQDAVPGRQGKNDFGNRNYGGPCPPSGTHRYFFKIYALDAMLDLKEGLSKKELERSMQGHIVEKAELVGLYKRAR
jgi:Raf kinase inhibitor-like YbhB/YbcL family protein